MRILAVEDDPVARAVLIKALKRLGHEAIEATNGEEAWSRLATDRVRLVVSDWNMPGMDGLELCQKIRGRVGVEYVYFILLTANEHSMDNQQTASDAGVDDFLNKPLNVQQLWMRLRVAERVLRFSSQVTQLEQMLPICSYCKKVRDDKNYWQQIEGYIRERTGSEFSHSVCPDCYKNVVLPQIQASIEKAKQVAAPVCQKHPGQNP